MLTRVYLNRFKNFKEADLLLGPLTTIIGVNASGKSNLRDAFRMLHGISRGYNIAEIIGEKWGEEGVLQWKGIRGGTREVAYDNSESFSIRADMAYEPSPTRRRWNLVYDITIRLDKGGKPPEVIYEKLESTGGFVFFEATVHDKQHVKVTYHRGRRKGRFPPSKTYINGAPILFQIHDDPEVKTAFVRSFARGALDILRSCRFLDLSPQAMRHPSIPGQVTLGDRGENLSSVLYAICRDKDRKDTLVEWIRELTPMDASDFEFPVDTAGRVLVTLVESGGRRTSAYSASDGTLRFLAMIAALLGPEPAKFYFFEEIDNGIHPTRLSLLLQLIERKVGEGNIRLVATTHSPQLLGFLSEGGIESAYLTYRLRGKSEAQVKRILDIPEARRLLENQGVARLHASGWLENAVEFTDDGDEDE